MNEQAPSKKLDLADPAFLRGYAEYFRKPHEARELGIRDSYLHSCANDMERAAAEIESVRKALAEAGYVGTDPVSGIKTLRMLFDAERAGNEPPDDRPTDEHVARFSNWLAREMPAGTVIGDPNWWARKLLNAAYVYAPDSSAPPPGSDADELRTLLLIARRYVEHCKGIPWNAAGGGFDNAENMLYRIDRATATK